jgi:predicted aspartyl protease
MKKLFLILFLFLFVITHSQKISLDQGIVEPQKYYEEISIEMVYEKMVVPVTINNKTYRFLVDTGAPNIISNELFEELRIKPIRTLGVSDANESTGNLLLTVIEKIQLGSIHYKNTVALVSDLKNHPALGCYNIDGFIGSNLLKNSVVKFDLSNKKMILTDDSKKLNLNSKPIKLKLIGAQKSPYVEVSFIRSKSKKATELLLIDTGMDGFYDISKRAFKIFNEEGDMVTVLSESIGSSGMGLFGGGEESLKKLIQLKGITLHQTTFENIITSTTKDNNSRLGLDILNHGIMVIDFKSKKFYFEGEEKVILDHIPSKLDLTIIDGKFAVGLVWDNILKEKLTYGDIIIKINDDDFTQMEICEIIEARKKREKGKPFDITVQTKDNSIITLNIQP